MPTKKLSPLERLKLRLARNEAVTNAGPDRVSQLIGDTTKKLSDAKDLRAIQTHLLAEQRRFKQDKPIRDLVGRSQVLAHRARLRRPLKSAVVHQALSDHDGRIYLELSSGQSVRADKPHRSLHLRRLIHNHLSADLASVGLSLKQESKLV